MNVFTYIFSAMDRPDADFERPVKSVEVLQNSLLIYNNTILQYRYSIIKSLNCNKYHF